MSKYELQKLFFKKSKKLLMTSFFRSRSWSRTLPVSVSKPKLRSRPVLVSEKFRGLGLGLGLGRVSLDYSPVYYTSCITPKRVTSLLGPSPRHCARATQLHSKICCSGGKWLGHTVSDSTSPRF